MLFAFSPLHLVCPIRGTHLAFGDVLSVTGFEGCLTGSRFTISRHSLLSETYRLDLTTLFSHDDVRLGGMAWGPFGLVEA